MARNATLAEAVRIAHRMRAGQETAEEIDALSGWLADVLQPPAPSPPAAETKREPGVFYEQLAANKAELFNVFQLGTKSAGHRSTNSRIARA